MDAADIAWLQTAPGRAATAEAAALLAGGAASAELPALRRLSRTWSATEARAAVALVLGRRALAGKHRAAGTLFCDHAAAEQTSDERVASHLAARFAGCRYVADVGCGMGGDALALAAHARVLALDRDEARLAMTAANAVALGLAERVTTRLADAEVWSPADEAGIDALWCDPARRDESERRLRPDRWSPPLDRAIELVEAVGAGGIKLAPGIDLDALPTGDGWEVEFVSLDRGLRAAVLWHGRLARAPRTATVLPDAATLAGEPDEGATPTAPPGRILYDPDPAVGRAGLIDVLAPQLEAWKLDAEIAYLSADRAVETPFARRFEVLDWLPFSERRLVEALRRLGAARVDVTRRGSPVETNALERRLNRALQQTDQVGQSAAAVTVVLTRVRGEHVAILCARA